jgi:hypothetical protein
LRHAAELDRHPQGTALTIDELRQQKRTFDYIFCYCLFNMSGDINAELDMLHELSGTHSRVVVYQYNYLWEPLLRLAGRLHLKKRETIRNWISIGDLRSYAEARRFHIVRTFRNTLVPTRLFGMGSLFNTISNLIPLGSFCKLDQFVVLKKDVPISQGPIPAGLTICITVRNERDNIRPIVESIPQIAEQQEILFVEGHSTDGTWEEIEKAREALPHKRVRVLKQPGIGQGDAIRFGFRHAEGEVIVLYEGDGTSKAEDIRYFYESICSGAAEFIEGSRFVYPLSNKSMPMVNKLGNIIFARFFSALLGQRFTDVLSGIKAITKEGFKKVDASWGFLQTLDPFGDFELLYGAARYGLRIGEVPMQYQPRPYGETKTRVLRHGVLLGKLALYGYIMFRFNRLKRQKT